MNDITALAQRMKAAAEKAIADEGLTWWSEEQLASDYGLSLHPADAKFIALASHENVLALVEALEAKQPNHNGMMQISNELVMAKQRIAELESIHAAAEKLVRCKGRYHSEQNYRALASLFGVNTPDLPPLESESRTVTVKLRDINEYLAVVHDKTLRHALRLTAEGVRAGDIAAMTAAGINVEAE